jgi:hypothetical protein
MDFNDRYIEELDSNDIYDIIDYKIDNLEQCLATNVIFFSCNVNSPDFNPGLIGPLLEQNKTIRNELATYYLERAASCYEIEDFQAATYNVGLALDLDEHCDFKEMLIPFANGFSIDEMTQLESFHIIRRPEDRDYLSSLLEIERESYFVKKEIQDCQTQIDVLTQEKKRTNTTYQEQQK